MDNGTGFNIRNKRTFVSSPSEWRMFRLQSQSQNEPVARITFNGAIAAPLGSIFHVLQISIFGIGLLWNGLVMHKCGNQLVASFAAAKRPIDILVNSAGITYNKLLVTSSNENVKKVLDTNLLGTVLFTRSIVKQMIKQKNGSIISIGMLPCVHSVKYANICFYRKHRWKQWKHWPNNLRCLKSRTCRLY